MLVPCFSISLQSPHPLSELSKPPSPQRAARRQPHQIKHPSYSVPSSPLSHPSILYYPPQAASSKKLHLATPISQRKKFPSLQRSCTPLQGIFHILSTNKPRLPPFSDYHGLLCPLFFLAANLSPSLALLMWHPSLWLDYAGAGPARAARFLQLLLLTPSIRDLGRLSYRGTGVRVQGGVLSLCKLVCPSFVYPRVDPQRSSGQRRRWLVKLPRARVTTTLSRIFNESPEAPAPAARSPDRREHLTDTMCRPNHY